MTNEYVMVLFLTANSLFIRRKMIAIAKVGTSGLMKMLKAWNRQRLQLTSTP